MSTPSVATVKRLFALSGNKCAFPACEQALVDPGGKVTGRICHIAARSPNGPRHDSTQPGTDRHGFENLLLLCPIHHDVIDADEKTYSVAHLIDMKRSHEASVVAAPEPSAETARRLLATIEVSAPGGIAVYSQGQVGGITAGTITVSVMPPVSEPPTPPCFVNAEDAFSALIDRNFLLEFQGDDSDYVELLSGDLRRLFFSLFNQHVRSGRSNRLVVSGPEGSGKTFNTLLLCLQMAREGYSAQYCRDISAASLTADSLRATLTRLDEPTALVIDNVHQDLVKAEGLATAITHAGAYAGTPFFLFLTRPLEEDLFLDVFGARTPVLSMQERFVDFERLVGLFFKNLGRPEAAAGFLQDVQTARTSGILPHYRNVAFWNEVLRSLSVGGSFHVTENDVLQRAHSFLRRHEPHLLDLRKPLSHLLPLFAAGASVHRDHALELLGEGAAETVDLLSEHGVVSVVEHDWQTAGFEDSSALVLAPALHPTKAKLLEAVFRTFYGYTTDAAEVLAYYGERFPGNLYHILGPYWDPVDIQHLFRNARVQAVVRRYLLERRPGKQLDRVIRRLAGLDELVQAAVLDPQVIRAFAEHLNSDRVYLVSKMYLVRSVYRVDPSKAYQLFTLLKKDAVTRSFLADTSGGGVTSLAKWMELLKNIYYFAPTSEAKADVQAYVRAVIDECRSVFLERLEARHEFVTQLHWLLKRLHGLHLAAYFLEGVPPERLLALIRTKSTNLVELSRGVLWSARAASWAMLDGSRRSYYEMLREALTYEDLKRVFDDRRSDLYDLAMNATHDFVARALVRYADEPGFSRKVRDEKEFQRRDSIRLINTNWFLSAEEKSAIVSRIAACGHSQGEH